MPDFNITDPPISITNPKAPAGTSFHTFVEFPKHVYVTETVKEEDRPKNGTYRVVVDAEDEADAVAKGYRVVESAPIPGSVSVEAHQALQTELARLQAEIEALTKPPEGKKSK